jgi:hypothetical protein
MYVAIVAGFAFDDRYVCFDRRGAGFFRGPAGTISARARVSSR